MYTCRYLWLDIVKRLGDFEFETSGSQPRLSGCNLGYVNGGIRRRSSTAHEIPANIPPPYTKPRNIYTSWEAV